MHYAVYACRVDSRKHSTMLRVMPQDWEPQDWAEGTAARVAREITRLRDKRSAQWLSDRTAELGFRLSRSMITDLENGRRKYIAIHELIMLAQALSVAPLELLYGNDNGAIIEFHPGDQVTRLTAVQRFSGIDEDVLARYEETIESLEKAVMDMRGGVSALSKALKRANDGG